MRLWWRLFILVRMKIATFNINNVNKRLANLLAWLRAAEPDQGDDWPLPVPSTPDADDFFRLPAEKPKRPNPFGDD